jgi:hypothetical protein
MEVGDRRTNSLIPDMLHPCDAAAKKEIPIRTGNYGDP